MKTAKKIEIPFLVYDDCAAKESSGGPVPPGTNIAIWFPFNKISLSSFVLMTLLLSLGSGVYSMASSSTRLTWLQKALETIRCIQRRSQLGLSNLSHLHNHRNLLEFPQFPWSLSSRSIFETRWPCQLIQAAGFELP
jgi:hypothetical protein